MRRDRWSRLVGVVGAGLLGLALLGMLGGASAHQGDPGDLSLIHACVATRDGAVRIVGPTGAFNANKETAAHWAAVPSGRFIDLGLTVFDTKTKLLWEKKNGAGDGADLANLHDVDNPYTWCQATGDNTAGTACAGNTTSWIAQVNAENFAGYSDWRVPTGRTSVDGDGGELATILLSSCPGFPNPCIDPIFGPTAASFHWSATEFSAGNAWFVNFSDGGVSDDSKEGTIHVRAVRGGP